MILRSLSVWLLCLQVCAVALAQGMPPPAPEPTPGTGYVATGRRDPFRPFTLDMRPDVPRVALTPLQRYELGQLTVVGTVWAVNPPRAMLEDSAGMGFIVTIGTPIGRNGGVVTGIEPERVIVEERLIDLYGKEQVNRVVMETPKDDPAKAGREQK